MTARATVFLYAGCIQEWQPPADDLADNPRMDKSEEFGKGAAQAVERFSTLATSGPTSEPREHILQFFTWDHLPAHLQSVSRPFCELAGRLVASLPRNPERTVMLRKLLEAKDAAVRALLAE